MSYHLGRDEDRTIGVKPIVNKFRVLLRLTILNIILWSTWTFSTEKLNQNLIKWLIRININNNMKIFWLNYIEMLSNISITRYCPGAVLLQQYLYLQRNFAWNQPTCIWGYRCRVVWTDHTRNRWWNPLDQDCLDSYFIIKCWTS